ncbi:lamin tail domain-containing protein [Sorangium cellulosum]|nr:lamin tail domain-containing protein [Sorangium cellulosum]
MQTRNLLSIALLAAFPFALAQLVACGGDDSTGEGGADATTTTTTTTGSGGSGGGGGEGGSGGGGEGGGGEGGSGGGEGGSGGGEVAGEPAGHLLISEIVVAPGAAEFIEIWNPTETDVDLSNYYLSDNSVYYALTEGGTWMPAGTAGTDFLVQFPAGTTIAAGAYLVLASDEDFELEYGRCADFALDESPIPCGGEDVTPMVAPENGSLGAQAGALFTNDAEMVVLFEWDGTVGSSLKDVDYVTWGEAAGASARADKTGKADYVADTARQSQRPAHTAGDRESIARCSDVEFGELLTEGNGLSGHDETSEWLDVSFVLASPTPGEENDCPQP